MANECGDYWWCLEGGELEIIGMASTTDFTIGHTNTVMKEIISNCFDIFILQLHMGRNLQRCIEGIFLQSVDPFPESYKI